MSAPSAIAWGVVGCLLMAGLPVCLLIGGARSASCSLALNSRSRDASLLGLDGSFREWSCGFDGRAVLAFGQHLGAAGGALWDASFSCGFGGRPDSCGRVEEACGAPGGGSLASALAFSRLSNRMSASQTLPPPTSGTIYAA